MKKHLFAAIVTSSAFMYPIAIADTSDSGFYLTAGIGTGLETDVDGSINGDDFSATGRTTFGGGIGLGYNFDNNWRVEAGVARSTVNFKNVVVAGNQLDLDDNVDATAVLISAAYDFENDSKITPYIEGSYTIAWSDDADDSASGYGLNFGLSTPVSDGVELWGAVGLSFSSDQTENVEGTIINVDGGQEWGFSTGLRIRL
jgi:outer membrane protein W